jgi:branched-chain amino acid transport system permease protein
LTLLLVQFLSGLAAASSLFLVSVGLSIIFGVTRIVNFAHGSFYMLGAYLAYTLIGRLGGGALGFWLSLLLAALAIGVLGLIVEVVLLRRIYQAPELFQLLLTFGLVLVFKDVSLWLWGPEDLLGPRAPGLGGAVAIFDRALPQYDLALIVLGPAVLGLLYLLFHRTRWGVLVRAATEDRDMVDALGVNQTRLFTGVFFLGAFLAALGGAVQIPREPANLNMDLNIISEAFVVVVVGGMGSLLGAFLAALLISELNAFGILIFPKISLVLPFLVMAVVLVVRPWGLLGKPQSIARGPGAVEPPLAPAPTALRWAGLALVGLLALLPLLGDRYLLVLGVDILVFALFAASLHFMMGPGGMVSFGHAAYFGLGAYGAAFLVKRLAFAMEPAFVLAPFLALAGAMLFGWFVVRLSGVYLAMLTLAFAQIVWSVAYQWDEVTGGDNGLIGVWPADWLGDKAHYYWLTLVLAAGAIWLLRRGLFSPFGYALRAGRDSPLRAEAIGIDVKRVQWAAFAICGLAAGLAGALYVFAKGSVSPVALSIPRSVDGLVMVLLGGVQTLTGPLVGAALFTWLQDEIARATEHWRALLGLVIVALVLVFPQGVVGGLQRLRERFA